MKRALAFFLAALLALLPLASLAAEKTLTFQGVKVKTGATKLNMKKTVITSIADFAKFLKKLPNLKQVDMFSTPVTAADIDVLEKAVPNVKFGWTIRIPCTSRNKDGVARGDHLIRTDATAFSTLHNNESPLHTSEDFAVLKYCTQMRALDLGHNNVTDLNFLYSMPYLRVLIIGRNHVTDLTPVGTLKDLEYLEAFTNEIESVKPLLNCKHLMDLNIPNNRVTDPELFAEMKQLKRLFAYNYGWRTMQKDMVPASLKSLIKKALPNCRIDFSQAGVQIGKGTWRDSPHYDVIRSMFPAKIGAKQGGYIPFEDSYPDSAVVSATEKPASKVSK